MKNLVAHVVTATQRRRRAYQISSCTELGLCSFPSSRQGGGELSWPRQLTYHTTSYHAPSDDKLVEPDQYKESDDPRRSQQQAQDGTVLDRKKGERELKVPPVSSHETSIATAEDGLSLASGASGWRYWLEGGYKRSKSNQQKAEHCNWTLSD